MRLLCKHLHLNQIFAIVKLRNQLLANAPVQNALISKLSIDIWKTGQSKHFHGMASYHKQIKIMFVFIHVRNDKITFARQKCLIEQNVYRRKTVVLTCKQSRQLHCDSEQVRQLSVGTLIALTVTIYHLI